MRAQLCPVCHGSGKYHDVRCHGCIGLGWVQVNEETPSAALENRYKHLFEPRKKGRTVRR